MLQIDREHTLTSRQIDYASYILRGGHHLLALVNDVLDLNAIETGRLHLSIERVGVREMLDYVRSSMGSIAATSGVELDVSTPAAIADVRADQLRLRQVLINLVSNAIKYNRPGGAVALTALAAPGDQVRFVVTDTGIGIAPERQQDLFQPFNRLGAEYTGIEGTGIGLALSRQLVESMNGKIGFTSELGRGSTFWVELPAEAASTGAADRTPAAHGTPASGGYSLLYIEDNPASLRLMEHLISTLPGVAMLSAPTPQLGLDLAVAHRPDVIVLDLNLPGMHGMEVLNRLKGTAETRSIPVIALTAAAFPSDMKRGFAAGFFRYLTKPLDVKAFLAAVDDALASTRLRGNGSA
jgi:CheY-like chemotaxis protein